MASYDADDGEEKAEWTLRNEGIFIRILHEHVKKGDLQTSTFSKKTWNMICDELFAESNRQYTVPQLKSKFNRLRKKHREFTGLINYTGFKWDPNSNTVTASTDAWEEYIKRVPAVRAYRKKGLEYYYILGEIFNTTTVTGQMYHTSSQVPPNSDEDREVEENYFNSCVHVNLCEDVGETDPQVENSKGKRVRRFFDQSPSDRRLKNILDRMENYLEMCTEVMRRKLEKRKAKTQESDQFSTEECLQIVEAMGVDNDTYIKFVEKMVDIEWRKAFLCMSDDRRRGWLAHLN